MASRTEFYAPASLAGTYVSNVKDEQGVNKYDTALNEVGLARQKAIQAIESNYSTTIDNAYASYLANNQNILSSAMGQSAKQAYLAQAEQGIAQTAAEANLTAASARAQIQSNYNAQQAQLQGQFTQEVSNVDRALAAFNDYRTYLEGFTTNDEQPLTYLQKATGISDTQELADVPIDDLYQILIDAQPQGIVNRTGEEGAVETPMTYIEWYKNKLSNETDSDYYKWLFGQGGFSEVRDAISTVRNQGEKSSLEIKSEQKELNELKQKVENFEKGYDDRKDTYDEFTYKKKQYQDNAYKAKFYTGDMLGTYSIDSLNNRISELQEAIDKNDPLLAHKKAYEAHKKSIYRNEKFFTKSTDEVMNDLKEELNYLKNYMKEYNEATRRIKELGGE